MAESARRPIAARNTNWARFVAAWLAQRRVAPNTISVASVVFAAMAGLCAWMSRDFPWWLLGTALGIQLRLLCNLFDGMVAVEGGLKTKTGDVYNDLPDRFADLLILVPLGYATLAPWGGELGWAAGAMAVFMAYVRLLGGALGVQQDYAGPMAKQQRMATATAACPAAIAESYWHIPRYVLIAALVLITLGAFAGVLRRSSRILRQLATR
jgi:phosphatidylglycerophosphate synthase